MAQSLYRQASLVMNPYGAKDTLLPSIKPTNGDGDFTFSRDGAGASPATRVNASGFIEKGRENVLLQSNTLNLTWSPVRASVNANTTADPFGGSEADSLIEDTTASNLHYLSQGVTAVTGVHTFSIYAKANTRSQIQLAAMHGTTSMGRGYDLSSGTLFGESIGGVVANDIDQTITDVGNGWYRCTMTWNATGNTAVWVLLSASNQASYTGDGTSGVYLYGAQLEQGLVATDYIETTTAPVSAGLLGDMPRLDYSGGATCPSLLLEPSRVNSLANSEYIGGSGWTKLASTTSYNEITTPEGVDNSVKLKPNNGITFSIPSSGIFTAGASSYVRSNGITLTATDYTFSVFVKKGDFDHLQLRSGTDVDLTANATTNLINLNDGTASVANSVEEFGNGWYRVSLTFTATAATWYVGLWFWNTTSVTANGSQGVYAYGAQLESGSYPTSYIPTYGSASTRGQDSGEITSASAIIGQTEGTIFLQVGDFPQEFNGRIFAITQNSNNYITILKNGSNDDFYVLCAVGAASQVSYQGTGSLADNAKIAIAYANNDYVIYVNGMQVHTDTSASVPTCSNIFIGKRENGTLTYATGGSVKQSVLFPTRLTNAELAALTA